MKNDTSRRTIIESAAATSSWQGSDHTKRRERDPGLRLTRRELEVLALLCEGLPNKLISRRLNISAATVKCHISRILDELGVSSRLQAVVVAARFGLIADASERATPAVPPHPGVPRDSAGDRPFMSRGLIAAVA
jgi:DNA-binding NarL/FixJ family response regulator